MRILELKPSRRKKGRFLLKLEDETILRVTEDELLRFSLRPGMELGEEELEALRASAGASAAKAAAANIIGARALSKKELTSRLVKKGTGQADAEAAAGWLEDIGALDTMPLMPPPWAGTTPPRAMAPPGSGRSSAAGAWTGSSGTAPWRSFPRRRTPWTP